MRARVVAACLLSGACALYLVANPPELSFKKDVQPVVNKECLDCHSAEKHKGKLDLSEANAYKNLVNAPSDELPAMMRVKPGDPDNSYLWLKLEHKTKEGSGMPKGLFGAKSLPQDQKDVIRNWIAQGAKE
jgi:hypothetical protein